MALAPRIASLRPVRKGVRHAVSTLRRKSIGFVPSDEARTIAEAVDYIQEEGAYSLNIVCEVLGKVLAPLKDAVEYKIFSDIALPESNYHRLNAQIPWSASLNTAVVQHFQFAMILKTSHKSYPKFRKPGSDYCEDMIINCTRIMLRPSMVKFARALEDELGWPSVEESGLLDRLQLKPREVSLQ